MARPIEYNIDKLVGALENYIIATDIPIVAEFAFQYPINRQYLYELAEKEGNEELSDTLKRAIDKKEANLERFGLDGKIDKTMAIFSLKQLGWRDKVDIDTTSKGEKIVSFDTAGIARDLYALLHGHKNDTEGDGQAEGKEGNGGE